MKIEKSQPIKLQLTHVMDRELELITPIEKEKFEVSSSLQL